MNLKHLLYRTNQNYKDYIRKHRYLWFGLSMFSGVVTLMLSLSLFWVGFHNFDSSQNWRWLEATYNISLGDTALNGVVYSPTEGYILGLRQVLLSIPILCYSIFYLTAVICKRLYEGVKIEWARKTIK